MLSAASLVGAGLVAVSGPATAAPEHDRVVSATPKLESPRVMDERVNAIYDAGQKIIAGGPFTRVRSFNGTADIARASIFAFDEDTGVVDTAFAPTVNGEVTAITGGPTAGTVYIAGRFTDVNGQPRPKVALLNVADGSVTAFRSPPINGLVSDIALAGDRLLVGGNFTTVGGVARNGLASLNATTGVLDEYLTTALTENHNWTPGSTGARAPVGTEKLAVSPDGDELVVIGNFKKAAGQVHDQVVKFNLGATAATIANWNTDGYVPACAAHLFDSYVRDVAYSPDGSYFVIATSGASVQNTLCDTASRWESDATGPGQQPTWSAFTGGDTLLSTAISEKAVYVGGHQRWMNNNGASDTAFPGAVARPGIAALDPVSGTPLAWNPGRNPRGFGTSEMFVSSQGLWIGYDQEWIGNFQFKRDRIAFFPLAGGAAPHATNTLSLPGRVYTAGASPPNTVLHRVNGGGELIPAIDGGIDWAPDTQAAPSPRHDAGLGANAGRPMIANVTGIPAATPRELFSSERFGISSNPDVNWSFPVARGTPIQVRLYFANRCQCAVGMRRMHINIDGVRKATNFDITSSFGNEVGGMRAYNVTSDGTVNIDLIRVGSSALVNAVEIVRTTPPPATGLENKVFSRTYDGNTTVSPRTERTVPAGPWYAARGAFWIGGTLFYGQTGALYRRTFDGTTAGPAQIVDPYHDPRWDSVPTNSPNQPGQTYRGATPIFYQEIPSVTGMFYSRGRLYYTVAGQNSLFWRAFNPDSGVVGAQKNTITSPILFGNSGGVFLSGTGKLYIASRITGNLTRVDWVNEAPGGTPTLISGPGVDGQDWRGKAVFVGP